MDKELKSVENVPIKDPASFPARIGRVFENKEQFEEAVQHLMLEYDLKLKSSCNSGSQGICY